MVFVMVQYRLFREPERTFLCDEKAFSVIHESLFADFVSAICWCPVYYVFASLVCVHAAVRLSAVFCTILSHLTLSAYSFLFHHIAHVCGLIPVHENYRLFISDFEFRLLLFCVCAVAVWTKNITCENAKWLQFFKTLKILIGSQDRQSSLLTCLPVLHFSSDMLPSSFLRLLHVGVRHISDKDANLYVWLRHEIQMKYDVLIRGKYNYDSSWNTSLVSVHVNIMALWNRQ